MSSNMNLKTVTRMACFCVTVLATTSPLYAVEDRTDEGNDQEKATRLEPVIVTAGRPIAASSEIYIPGKDFELRPQGRPADLLRLAPGLVIAQHQGGGKAEQTFLRGFDNDHGTDIALFVDSVPVNVPSHAHGQGYADLHFLIPETVNRVEVSKGPFQVEYGDFATSGAVNFVRKETADPNFIQAGGGSFSTQRYLTMFSPVKSQSLPWLNSLMAIEQYYSDGPFINAQKYKRFNGYGSLTAHPTDDLSGGLTYSYLRSSWHGSGQIPLREVRAGRLDRFGAIDPSEGGDTDRMVLTAEGSWKPSETQAAKATFYAQRYDLDLFSNFTFFQNDRVHGDGIEQVDERWIFGSDTSYSQTAFPWNRETIGTLGFQTRWDRGRGILAKQQGRVRLSETQDVDLSQYSYGPYVKVDSRLLSWLRFVGGSRFDFYRFGVDDRLSTGVDGSVEAWAPSVKGNLIFGPWWNTEFFLNAASGFHSNDARDVVRNPNGTQLPQAVSYEAGARSQPSNGLDLFASLWILRLQSELVLNGDDGTFTPKGSTRRYGTEMGAKWKVTDWFSLYGDLTLSKAYFLGNHEAVPLAPQLTSRMDATVKLPYGLESSLEMRVLGNRWLVEDRSWKAHGYTLFTWTNKYRWKRAQFFLSIENLLNTHYREAQFLDTSQLRTESSPVTDVHLTPGNPRAVLGGVTIDF